MFIFLRNMHIFYNSCKTLHFHQQCTRFVLPHANSCSLLPFFSQYISLCILFFFPFIFLLVGGQLLYNIDKKHYNIVISLLPFLILPILTAMSGFDFHFPNKLSNFLSSGWPSIYHLFKKLTSLWVPCPFFKIQIIAAFFLLCSINFFYIFDSIPSQASQVVKNPPANSGDAGSIPRSEASPTGGNGNPLWYSCLENPMDRGAWWATVHMGSQKIGHN